MSKMWNRILVWLGFREVPCEHEWRPIVAQIMGWNESKPARQCSKCKGWEPLTEAEFYGQFGESFYAASKKARL